jgi:hypothetical protein
MKTKVKNSNHYADDKQNHLAAAEVGEEENYNQIDGVISNVPKPSLLERMKEYEQRIAEAEKTAEPPLCCPTEKEI